MHLKSQFNPEPNPARSCAPLDHQCAAAWWAQHAKVAALEKQNQQLGWQVAMLADRAAGAGGKAAETKPRRSSPGSVPTATQASLAPAQASWVFASNALEWMLHDTQHYIM